MAKTLQVVIPPKLVIPHAEGTIHFWTEDFGALFKIVYTFVRVCLTKTCTLYMLLIFSWIYLPLDRRFVDEQGANFPVCVSRHPSSHYLGHEMPLKTQITHKFSSGVEFKHESVKGKTKNNKREIANVIKIKSKLTSNKREENAMKALSLPLLWSHFAIDMTDEPLPSQPLIPCLLSLSLPFRTSST